MNKSNVVKLKDIQKYLNKCKNKSIHALCIKNSDIVDAIYWMRNIGNVQQQERIHVSGWNWNTEETILVIKQIKK